MADRIDTIVGDVEDLKTRVESLEQSVAENTRLTRETRDNTSGLVEAFEAARGAFKVLEFLGKIAKPFLWVIALPATAYGAWQVVKPSIINALTFWK